MKPFDILLKESGKAHGHLCPGQVVGVRMAMLGCRLVELDHPKSPNQIKKLLVYVEMDRCTADAIAQVTGVKLGRRSLKFMDYGIMAATFLNLATRKAYRIISTEASRELSPLYAPGIEGAHQIQLEAYKRMPDSVLFRVQRVRVTPSRFDMPGPTQQKVRCHHCGQVVRDNKQVEKNGRILCKVCAGNCYFSCAAEISWPDMNWAPGREPDRSREAMPC